MGYEREGERERERGGGRERGGRVGWLVGSTLRIT
jgi:hypothetical protein